MKRTTQSGVRRLSAEAQALAHRMLDQEAQPAAIARAIRAQTGERVTPAAVTRYASVYRKQQEKLQQIRQSMDGLVARAQKDGILVSDLLRAVLIERLSKAEKDGTAADLDLLKLEEAERKRGEYELKQRQAHFSNLYREQELDLKKSKHHLAEKQFALQRERARANFQELERKAQTGQPLTPDDIRRIREIYGLEDEAEATETRRHGE